MRHLTFKSWIGPAVSAARIEATDEPLGTLARRIFAVQRHSALRQIHTRRKKNLQIRFRLILDLLRIQYFARRHAASVRRQRG